MNERFRQLLAERYPIVRSKFPREGRRKWRLRVIEDVWLAPELQAEIVSAALNSEDSPKDADFDNDDDPLDLATDGEEVGLLVRTDFSNDSAWNTFVQKLQEAETELLTSIAQGEDTQRDQDMEMHDDAVESDSESESTPSRIIKVLPTSSDPLFDNISNLTALRLFNDVDIRLAPSPLPGTNRVKPSNRLIDYGGLQEIYSGKTIWIYDGQSILDESVRLVSQQGDVYGTATGDSWRARASHVAELQFNMSYYNMKIDFGGLDRWDYLERARNLNEAQSLDST
ncbi:hypothetical protein P691DRAFT_805016, partial [Macrolepiota fuliginosa MF-IS2]